MGLRKAKLFGLALFVLVAMPSSAEAAITIGSDLSATPGTQALNCAPAPAPCTNLLGGVHTGNPFPARSPTSGTVLSFGVRSASADTLTFRLGSTSGVQATAGSGAGTGPTVHLAGPGAFSFPANLPISAGDLVGFDSSSSRAYGDCFVPGAFFNSYSPPLVDGAAPQSTAGGGSGACELLVNAVVEPSSSFTFGAVKLNKALGSAKLSVAFPGPGSAVLSGPKVKRFQTSDAFAGTLKLPVKPTKRTKKKLLRTGKQKVAVTVTFSPTGGTPSSQSAKIKLVIRKH